jgi:glycosyltransferase involved in cell wall biosynthesis
LSSAPHAPIRIGLCITELEPGGAERCLVELAGRLDRARFQPVVYCLAPRPSGNADLLARRLEESGTSVHYFGARGLSGLPWIARRLTRQIARDAPLVLQCMLFHANALGAWAAHRAGVRHIVTGIRVAERRHDWHLRVARWADRWVERHVCVSQSVRDFSEFVGRLPGRKLVVIPNGVDLQRFAMATPCSLESLGLVPGRRAIAVVGRLEAQKGLDRLIGLLPRIFDGFPMHDLVIVGTGPDRAALARQAADLGFIPRVHFLGFRPNVPEILAASDVLVLPSRWEGMPNVVLEAMAASRPVVAYDVEGVTEALGPAAAQQVVRPEHAEALVAKLHAILKAPDFAAELGRMNRARVEQHFRVEAMVQAYERLYQSLCDGEN